MIWTHPTDEKELNIYLEEMDKAIMGLAPVLKKKIYKEETWQDLLGNRDFPRRDEWFEILLEIINKEWVKVNEDGEFKYRSGMDAGTSPPFWFSMTLDEVINEYKESHV